MSRALNILYCTDQIYKHGGVERVTTTKLNGWIRYSNNNIYLATTEQKQRPNCYELDSRVKTYDLEIDYYRNVSYFNIVNIAKTLQYIYKLNKLIRELKPDVIVCVNSGPINLFLPFIAAKSVTINEFHSSKFIDCNIRNSLDLPFKKRIIIKLNSWVEKKFTKCVVLNESELDYFINDNVVVIPNPISISEYKEHPRNKIVVAAGRIAPVKGYDLLIDVWQLVNIENPTWKLHIYGDGDDKLKEKLMEKVKTLKLEKKVIFCGATNDLYEVFSKSSIHVLSSLQESFAMVILEAQACGTPTVAFNCPTGPSKLIQNDINGILVEPYNIKEFASKINYLINNPTVKNKMGVEAKKNCSKYSTEKIIKKWDKLFVSLITKKIFK